MDIGASSYRLYLEGDEGAFEAIVKEYRDPLTFFINGYVRDIFAAEDIAIDVFAYVAVNTRRYNFSVSFKTYLFMLGRSRAIDYIRRRKRSGTVSLDTATEITDGESVEERYLRDEKYKKLYLALDRLPEKMRTAVYLIYFEELSYTEAAKVMKMNKKQIDNLLYRAKAMLRNVLGEEGSLNERS